MRELPPTSGTLAAPAALEERAAGPHVPGGDLLETARKKGWQRAAHDLLRARDRQAYRMAVDEYRANWRLLLPITSRSRVLELHCGHGAASLVLAEVSGTTTAVDAGRESTGFAALRGRQQGGGNLRVLRSPPTGPLPFRDSSFDVVAYTGDLTVNTATGLLSEGRRVLVDGGCIYVATGNRRGLRLSPFAARRRRSARFAGQPAGNGARAGHGLTAACLRELLRAAGFPHVRMYAALPSHELAFFFVPVDDPRVFAYYVRRLTEVYDFGADLRRQGLGFAYTVGSWGARLACCAGLAAWLRHLVPSIAAVAEG